MPLKVNIQEKKRLCTYIHAAFEISLTLDKPVNVNTELWVSLVFSHYSFTIWTKGNQTEHCPNTI